MKYIPFLLVLFFVGCNKALPPADLPPLVSCKVKVHDNGHPLPEIGIFFKRIEGHGGWGLSGQTGSDGVAIAQTVSGSYRAPGLPTGSYRITLSERVELPPELIGDSPAMEAKQEQYRTERRTVPPILSDPSRTPLELVVDAPGAELDIDISRFK